MASVLSYWYFLYGLVFSEAAEKLLEHAPNGVSCDNVIEAVNCMNHVCSIHFLTLQPSLQSCLQEGISQNHWDGLENCSILCPSCSIPSDSYCAKSMLPSH